LVRALAGDVRHHRTTFDHLVGRLQPRLVVEAFSEAQGRTVRAATALDRDMTQRLDGAKESVEAQVRLLRTLSYQNVLERGFALVRDGDRDRPIKRVAETGAGDAVVIEFSDGFVGATVGGDPAAKKETRAPSKAPPRGKSPDGGQGDFF
jgi:exodeoxyribonuclease VII large subunit